jgi:hypothetical protein
LINEERRKNILNVDLNTLAGGELQAKFNQEITKVLQNMQDPNTPFGESRSITINMTFKQTEQRDDAKVDISVKSKIAGVISAKTNFVMEKDLETGEIAIREYGKQMPGQMSLTDIQPTQTTEKESNITKIPRNLKKALN